jgi:hypothetical protein
VVVRRPTRNRRPTGGTSIGGTTVATHRKIMISVAAVVMPLTTVVAVGAVAVPPAFAAPARVFCTQLSGTVHFKQSAAPVLANGLTQQGYFESTSAKSQTTTSGLAAGKCYTGTSTAGTPRSSNSISPLAAIKTNPCRVLVAATPPIKECNRAVPLPSTDSGKYWYGSGWAFQNAGTQSLLMSVPRVTFTTGGVTLVFHARYDNSVLTSSAETGFLIGGYVTSTNAAYNDGASTCTATTVPACPAKMVALLGTDTGTHITGNTTASFLKDIAAIIPYTTQPPGSAASRAVKILTALLDNGIQSSSTATLTHSYFQS